MVEAPPGARARPLSPHLQVWRWHVTLTASILHRMTGAALYVGALILAAWALSLAAGPTAYGDFMGAMHSIVGQIVLFGLTLSVFYHLAAGVRHLVWDSGKGFALPVANASAWACLAFAVLATTALWLWAAAR